jgi:hypothetical protein
MSNSGLWGRSRVYGRSTAGTCRVHGRSTGGTCRVHAAWFRGRMLPPVLDPAGTPAAGSLPRAGHDPVTLSCPLVTEGTENPVFVGVRALGLAGSTRGARGVPGRSVRDTRAVCRAVLSVAVTWCLTGRPGCCLKCPLPMGAKNRARNRIYRACGFLRRGLVPVRLPCTPRDLTGAVTAGATGRATRRATRSCATGERGPCARSHRRTWGTAHA